MSRGHDMTLLTSHYIASFYKRPWAWNMSCYLAGRNVGTGHVLNVIGTLEI